MIDSQSPKTETVPGALPGQHVILTPDQRVRVFVSSTLQELAAERVAVRGAISQLHFIPVMFELGARPHAPRSLYRAYLEQSHIFTGIYWQRYGWIAPDMDVSGLEDEYNLSGDRPKLIYIKAPAPEREPRLKELLARVQNDEVSYKYFSTPDELRELVQNDLALLMTETFEQAHFVKIGGVAVGGAGEGEAGTASTTVQEGGQLSATGAVAGTPVLVPVVRDFPNNLPVQRGALVGRVEEMAALRALLVREDTGLVTLTGAGGGGKTRLALEVARRLVADRVEQFSGGVFMVPLAPVRDPDLIVPTIAQSLGLHESPGQTLLESIKIYIGDKRLLLLLDNFEQVVGGAPIVVDLLASCPGLKVLVTSRMPLHVRGEKTYPVLPLEVPELERVQDLERLSHYAAVELFIQRAQEVKPDFSVTAENAAAIAEICQRLDGLPLAIELAAARIKLLTPKALLARLGSRLELLTGGAVDLPTRQQTLRSAIGWSYDLLSPNAKMLFRRLGVFVGGFTLEAAESVCNASGDFGEDLIDELGNLIDNSLVKQTEDLRGEPRFQMLQIIREYALEMLSLRGEGAESEATAMRYNHARYFLKVAEEVDPHMMSGERRRWLDSLEADLDNVRAILAWAGSSQDGEAREIEVRMAGALGWFWYMSGHLTEGYKRSEEVLARLDTAEHTPERAKLLYALGGMAWAIGDYQRARPSLEEALALSRELGDKHRTLLALIFLSLLSFVQGDYPAAERSGRESVDLAVEIGDTWNQAFALRLVGDAVAFRGDMAAAARYQEEALALLRTLGDPWLESLQLQSIGIMRLVTGAYAEAKSYFKRSMDLSAASGDRWTYTISIMEMAHVAIRENNAETARRLLNECIRVWHDLGSTVGPNMCIGMYGMLAVVEGKLERAARLLGAADKFFNAQGYLPYALTAAPLADYAKAARSQLDGATWQKAWDEGSAMTLEQALAYTQQEE